MGKIRYQTGLCLLCGLLLATAGCGLQPKAKGKPPAPVTTWPVSTTPAPSTGLLFKLDDKCSSPDGMCIGKDGYIYLSMNNKNTEFKDPCKIMRISPDDKLEDFCELPGHPDTKICSPLGIGFGSDGNLYVSDNQMFVKDSKPGTSRVLRINIENGKAGKIETVATGLNMANGLACWGDCVFVADSTLGGERPVFSGVYGFKISELKADNPVKVTSSGTRLFFSVYTANPDPLYQVGANGLDFDKNGNMYVCNFGDAEVLKVTFLQDISTEVNPFAWKIKFLSKSLAKGQGMLSTDGLHADDKGNLWVADFMGNAIFKINAETGAVTMITKNEPCKKPDCASGHLHAPSECIRRGNKVYVSNIDITYGPNVRHDVHTMSVITLVK